MTERDPVLDISLRAGDLEAHLEAALAKTRRLYELGLMKRGWLTEQELAEARRLAHEADDDLDHAAEDIDVVTDLLARSKPHLFGEGKSGG